MLRRLVLGLIVAMTPRIAVSGPLDFDVKDSGAGFKLLPKKGTGFVVTKSSSGSVEVGDQLVAVNGVPLSQMTLHQALQRGADKGAILLPLVTKKPADAVDDGTPGENLRAFIKLEVIAPQTMRFRPLSDARKKSVRAKLQKTRSATAQKASREKKLREMEERKQRLREAEAARAKAAEQAREMEKELEAQKAKRIADAKKQALAKAREEASRTAKARAEQEAAANAAKDGKRAAALAEQEKRKAQWEERKKKAMKQAEELEARREKAEAERQRRVDEQSARKAALESEAKAKRKKADFARRKALGEAYEYTAVFGEPGIMGLQFDANAKLAEVSFIERTGSAAGLPGDQKIAIKDRLIAVNGVPTETLNAQGAMRILLQAEWPRKLTFLRPEGGHTKIRKQEEDKERKLQQLWNTKLVITEPIIVAGYYNVSYAQWSAKFGTNCVAHGIKLSVADPDGNIAGCKPDKANKPLPAGYKHEGKAMRLMYRGHCTFVDKAARVTESGDGGALVINTEEKPLAELKSGNQKTDGMAVTVSMMTKSAGEMLHDILTHGVEMKGFLTMADACKSTADDIKTMLNSATVLRGLAARRGKKGTILFWDANLQSVLIKATYQGAFFGNRLTTLPRRVVYADPPEACEAEKISPLAAGAIVLVHRGVCAFGLKVKAVMQRRAKAVIVVNTQGAEFPMQCEPNERKILKIQAATMHGNDGGKVRDRKSVV